MTKIGKHRAYAVGFGVMEVLLTPVLLTVLGDWGDRHFQCAPWLMVSGLTLGSLAALRGGFRLYRQARRIMENDSPNGDPE